MRRRLWQSGLHWTAGAALLLAGLARAVLAQEPADAAAPIPPPNETKAVARADDTIPGEVSPKVYYFEDKDGSLQAVAGITYEQIMELWKQQNQLAQDKQRPPFSIQKLQISGTASATSAQLVARLTIAVHEAGWVGVPLRFNDAVLREPPVYAGPGDHILHVEPERYGHVVWIRGQADQTHEVTLTLAAAVEQVGPQSRLQLSVPRSAVSQLQLQVPLADATAQVSESGTLDAVRPLAGGKTELKVIGLGGDFELTWNPAASPVASVSTILEATSEQVIRVNGRSVSTDAKLTIQSRGSEFDHFQVRLPPGADYVGTPRAGVQLVAVDANSAAGKLYEVRLDKKTVGPYELQLVTERVHNATGGDEMLQLAGFDVPGAVRQWGRIEVHVEGNWQIVWGDSNHVRPVDDVGGLARRDDFVAGFEYFVQPYTLSARVVPQTTRVRVEPEYVLLVGSDETRLEAKLKYTIHGAKKRRLEVELPGWEVDDVGPENLVNVDATITGVDDSLVFTLLEATSGEIELSFDAHRKQSPDEGAVALPLPRPEGDLVAANVAVVSEDNVELIPRPDETTGLAPQAVRPQITLPERQQEPLYYRTTADDSQFVAALRLHDQLITAAMNTQLAVAADGTQVNQQLAFQIAYQPTDHLTLSVPRQIRPEGLTILYEGNRVEPVSVSPGLDGDNETIPVRVNLPQPRIGRCELQITYAIHHDKPPSDATSLVVVPLVIPGEGELTANNLSVVPRPDVAVSYPPGPWTKEKTPERPNRSPVLSLSAERAIAEVTVAVSAKQGPAENATIVERAWIQSRLTDLGRQDLALLRISTRRARLNVRLPEGADVRSLVLNLDGNRVAPESIRQRDVTIALSGGTPAAHLLEIGYRFGQREPQGSLRLEGPRLSAATWIQQLYWQVVLPEHEHLLFAPPHYAEEFRWIWSDYFWRRQPTLDERELADWIGASPLSGTALAALDATGTPSALTIGSEPNRYLFSTVGGVEPLEVYTLSRARLVLYASLPLLACGLLLIYFPATRHPAVLFFLAVLVVAGSFIAPRSALLLAQASALGLGLCGLAVLLARLLPQPLPAASPSRGSSHGVIERSITELYQRPPSAGSQPASTSTDPLVPTSGEVES